MTTDRRTLETAGWTRTASGRKRAFADVPHPLFVLTLALALSPAEAYAQRVQPTIVPRSIQGEVSFSCGANADDVNARAGDLHAGRVAGIRPMVIVKWGALLGGGAAAAYGFIRNREADDLYRDLELACNADRAVCALRTPDGAYADPTLEALYQDVLAHDRASQRALIAGQAGVALAVVLFLLDLRSDDRPADIPYEPRRLQIAPIRGGVSINARLTF